MTETILAHIEEWLARVDVWLVLAALIPASLFWLRLRRGRRWRRRGPTRCGHRHARNVDRARAVFSKLNGWSGDNLLPRVLNYLRKIDAYTFEELIMTALEAQGIAVRRNRRYSGDGGSDGQFFMRNGRYLVRAKRYQGAINAQHVQAFGELIRREGAAGGIFVHTGTTPPGVYKELAIHRKITLVSGAELVDLMQARSLRIFSARCDHESPIPARAELR